MIVVEPYHYSERLKSTLKPILAQNLYPRRLLVFLANETLLYGNELVKSMTDPVFCAYNLSFGSFFNTMA